MTAEVAVLNDQAVALAADSAVTIGDGNKVYNAANKLFCLSRCDPVGIMIYGSGDVCGVPWEIVVKECRSYLGSQSFDTLTDYRDAFVGFCNENNLLFPAEQHEQWAIEFLGRFIDRAIHLAGLKAAKDNVGAGEAFLEILTHATRDVEGVAFLPNYDENLALQAVRGSDIIGRTTKTLAEYGAELPAQPPPDLLERLAVAWLYRNHSGAPESGIVVAGFGRNERFPSLEHTTVLGVRQGKLLCEHRQSIKITATNRACVRAFALSDMVTTFMEGVDPQYTRFLRTRLSKVLQADYPSSVVGAIKKLGWLDDDKLSALQKMLESVGKGATDQLLESAREEVWRTSVGPITDAVRVLPKEELGALAEALVNLTSLRKRVTLETETVGGPVDVAVISRGDGFIWIRRKHYFKPELNPQFFSRFSQKEVPR